MAKRARKPRRPAEMVELVTGEVFWSDDHWVTVKSGSGGRLHVVEGEEADRVRFIALHAHGGGRDDEPRSKR